ncbi:CapA family protein [Candidatus Gracilibacteria bacterium]|nr:MAG: CapA family protein [Candidatus Gracilibacteria bacterium]
MKKLFIFIISTYLSINQAFAEQILEFQKDTEYLQKKYILQENFKNIKSTEEKQNFIKNCLDFGEIFFGRENKQKGCIIQILDFYNSKDKYLSEKNKILENQFYKQNKIKYLELQFGGDIMLSRSVGAGNKRNGYDRIFKKFYPNKGISKDTILFYNLESPFNEIDNDTDSQTFLFKANKKNIQVLNELKGENTMFISLANNHITNAGGKGIDTTLELLDQNNIISLGVGREEETFKETVKNQVKVCISAFTYDGELFYSRDKDDIVQKYFINKISKENVLKNLKLMKENNCNFKIISLHWGIEYIENPLKNQEKLAHEIIDAGADLILGHHTHILGKIEQYKGKMIYYSLGNFIFDQDWGKTTNETGVDYKFDEVLGKNTVQTYIGNTFYNKYKIVGNKVEFVDSKNIKHRIKYGELSEY